ncbi:Rtf2 RING-finger-domain-containing protein [Crucibulum laeve]|uniref:Rtf2 RING-finger-domain-containing protein n=1 Tax=Crucibulum laeve TaxID=68775 RepID=A0A5C3M3P0_9AGAR|nr:Rtf2 RING-finger-domain-containing protein [Crucibulum laeve]
MGNDGGSIPDRRDLVRNKPKAEQADKANQTRARWFFCALSKRKLQEPIVSCALGKLYNKDSIIEFLLDKSVYGDGEKICGHIRSLKDVKQLKLTPNPSPSSANPNVDASERPQFVCPLTLKEMNGVQPFVYISTCGCVFSQAGLKTVTASSSGSSSPKDDDDKPKEKDAKSLDLCPQCAKKFSRTEDVVILNPSQDEEDTLRFALERKRQMEPPKKSKKRKNGGAAAGAEDVEPPTKKQATSGLNPSISAASRAVVSSLAEEEAKRKVGMSDAVKSLYGSADGSKRKETFMTMNTFTRYA